jgi:hypothetical protein
MGLLLAGLRCNLFLPPFLPATPPTPKRTKLKVVSDQAPQKKIVPDPHCLFPRQPLETSLCNKTTRRIQNQMARRSTSVPKMLACMRNEPGNDWMHGSNVLMPIHVGLNAKRHIEPRVTQYIQPMSSTCFFFLSVQRYRGVAFSFLPPFDTTPTTMFCTCTTSLT